MSFVLVCDSFVLHNNESSVFASSPFFAVGCLLSAQWIHTKLPAVHLFLARCELQIALAKVSVRAGSSDECCNDEAGGL